MADGRSLHDADIWLKIFFMLPEIAEHFAVITIEWHAIFPGLRNIPVLLKYKSSQELQTAFCRLLLLQKILVDGTKHTGLFVELGYLIGAKIAPDPNCGS